jgi:hypothetical protein
MVVCSYSGILFLLWVISSVSISELPVLFSGARDLKNHRQAAAAFVTVYDLVPYAMRPPSLEPSGLPDRLVRLNCELGTIIAKFLTWARTSPPNRG